jgi:hypothetical protein
MYNAEFKDVCVKLLSYTYSYKEQIIIKSKNLQIKSKKPLTLEIVIKNKSYNYSIYEILKKNYYNDQYYVYTEELKAILYLHKGDFINTNNYIINLIDNRKLSIDIIENLTFTIILSKKLVDVGCKIREGLRVTSGPALFFKNVEMDQESFNIIINDLMVKDPDMFHKIETTAEELILKYI